jgi:hypothetical protein
VLKLTSDVRVDGFVRFKVKRNLFLFSLVGEDSSHEQDETIGRDSIVKFETLLSAGNGCQYGKTIYSGLDVGRSPVLLRQQSRHAGNLVL